MTDPVAERIDDLVLANRILSREGIVDAFGHVSARHPEQPRHYLMSCSKSPNCVEASDIVELTLDSRPVTPTDRKMYIERAIHGAIYAARPDVHAICHHHAEAILPYCVTGETPAPISQLGAAGGAVMPIWDSRDEFGDTDLLVKTARQGESLARALGPHWVVLMRRHGATVVGRSIRDSVFRAINSCQNAATFTQARMLGPVEGLSEGEIDMVSNLTPGQVERSWEYWSARLAGSP
jgi:ribulose-5-phosphate 4-epimerase/fuculose-1-phosphate aldolase